MNTLQDLYHVTDYCNRNAHDQNVDSYFQQGSKEIPTSPEGRLRDCSDARDAFEELGNLCVLNSTTEHPSDPLVEDNPPPSLHGTVVIQRRRQKTREGTPYVLEADIHINNPEGNDIEFAWVKDQSFPDRVRQNNPVYYISKDLVGHDITCRIRCKGLSGYLISAPYHITEADFVETVSIGSPAEQSPPAFASTPHDPSSTLMLLGQLHIERNFTANIYRSKYNGGVALQAVFHSDNEIQTEDLDYQWGYVYPAGHRMGQMCPLESLSESPTLFWCRHRDAVGKTFRCSVRSPRYSGEIIAEYGPITEEDFNIPLTGSLFIQAQICTKEPHKNEIVLKATVCDLNINEKPTYTWLVGNKVTGSSTDSRLTVHGEDASQTFRCEIYHATRRGRISSEPFDLTLDTYSKLTAQLESRQNRASRTNNETKPFNILDGIIPVPYNQKVPLRSRIEKMKSQIYRILHPSCWRSGRSRFFKRNAETEIRLLAPDFRAGRYEGVVLYGLPNGYGTLITNDGNEYEGLWKYGHMVGYGSFRSTSGITFVGYWNGSYAEGQGRLTYPDGRTIEGLFHKGKPDRMK